MNFLSSTIIWLISQFFRKSIKSSITKLSPFSYLLNWHNNDFSESDYEEDSSDLVSRYIIKMKDVITDDEGIEKEVYRTLPKIVGADEFYPAIPLEKEIGIKTDIFEIEYKLENYDLAYEFAYKFLTSQSKKETVKIKGLNSKNNDLSINFFWT